MNARLNAKNMSRIRSWILLSWAVFLEGCLLIAFWDKLLSVMS